MKKQSPQNLSPKPVLFFADDKGGVGKTTAAATIADALRQYGYSVLLIDADHANRTLRDFEPDALQIDIREPGALDAFLPDLASIEHDIALVDFGANSADIIGEYFRRRNLAAFAARGIRIIVAPVIVEEQSAVNGTRAWLETFIQQTEFLLIANEMKSDDGFRLDAVEDGETLAALANNRVVKIPAFERAMELQLKAKKSFPSDFFEGGRRAQELKLNFLQSQLWNVHLYRVMTNLRPYLVWLTGQEPTRVPEENQVTPSPKTRSWEEIRDIAGRKP